MNYQKLYQDLQTIHQALNLDGTKDRQPNIPKAAFCLGAIMAKAKLRSEEQQEALTVADGPAYPGGLPSM